MTDYETQQAGQNGVPVFEKGVNGNGTPFHFQTPEVQSSAMTAEDIGPGSQVEGASPQVNVICGPLINYKHMDLNSNSPIWQGSVLIVTSPGQQQPRLHLRQAGPVSHESNGGQSGSRSGDQGTIYDGIRLYEDPNKAFWRFSLTVPVQAFEARWEYTIAGFNYVTGDPVKAPWSFAVPAVHESMRLMFCSCNGFSVGTDTESWAGPALWNDVLRIHERRPFHVMIGGGDQIYNDGVRVDGPLRPWTDIANPVSRRHHDFSDKMRADCDEYYYKNYVKWYTYEPFKSANGRIPQINVWDDHDIIDGFGSYTDHFMKCAVFRGIGGVAFKYYCLFQHHIPPPKSTFTTDAPETMHAVNGTSGVDPRQTENTFVLDQLDQEDPSWIIGKRPGPYVEEKSRSLYMRLGRRMAFIGIDARTERTRHQVNYPETYDAIFDRLNDEVEAANGEIKHLILLLGIPIAYPRLAWLENIFSSPLMAPLRLMNKRFGLGGNFFNKFDGQVDLLDDLDDHYTAKQHKRERKYLMHRLQDFSRTHSIRVTILSGDVHLAALGRFYSNLDLKIPLLNDYRYMVNVISSAITNKPPPKAVANLLASRNKIHHLDPSTDETMMALFDKQPGGQPKAAAWNKVTMPSRNFACITEVTGPATADVPPDGEANGTADLRPSTAAKDGHFPLHIGEENAGTAHKAASGFTSDSGMIGGLDISIRVEIQQGNPEGNTQGYGLSIPPLTVDPSLDYGETEWHLRSAVRSQHSLHSRHTVG